MPTCGEKGTNGGHVAVALLASNVPELEAEERAVIPFDLLDGKVHADGHLQLVEEHVLDVPVQDARLPARLLADHKNLKVVFLNPRVLLQSHTSQHKRHHKERTVLDKRENANRFCTC